MPSPKQSPTKKGIRRDIEQAARVVRDEMRTFQKDFLTGGKSWKTSTEKIVRETGPAMSAAIDDAMNRTSELFSKTMTIVEKQTHDTQIDLLKAYKGLLSRQINMVDRRLKQMKK